VLVEPAAAPILLAVFKSFTSVQFVPFHNSVTFVEEPGAILPPKAKAAVLVPFSSDRDWETI
jgi:hypothetical protein